jgi:hypothetical protein
MIEKIRVEDKTLLKEDVLNKINEIIDFISSQEEVKCKACKDTCRECVATNGDCWSCEKSLLSLTN